MIQQQVDNLVRRGREVCLVALVGVAVLGMDQSARGADVQWRSGSAEIARIDRAGLSQTLTSLAARADARHVVVQFDEAITLMQRKELQQAGLNLLRSLGNHAFFASFSERRVDTAALSAMPFLQGVEEIEPAWKMHPRVLDRDVPEWAIVKDDGSGNPTVAVYVLFHPDVPLATKASDVAREHEASVRSKITSINGLVVELPLANIDALTNQDEVQWIEWPLPPLSEVNDSNRVITEVNVVAAPPYGLDGNGVTAFIYDGGQARASHVDFEGRMTIGASDTAPVSDHSTHVACTVGGGGVANSTYTGMAPGVDLVSYGFEQEGGLQAGFLYTDPGDLEADYTEAISLYGVDLSNNSIGSNVESNGFDCTWQGDYGATGALIDAIVAGSLGAPFRIVWANGNERQGSRCDIEGYGDYYSTAPPAGAKNHITVGALNSNDDSMTYFSSWGPVDDGRMKPDISGPGCQSGGDGGVTSCSSAGDTSYTTMCGTSMAAPTVTGLLSLLMQDFRAQFPSEPDPRNSTLKILLAHDAVDLGNTGPDYQYGYGSVRIQQTVDFMRTGNFLENQVDQSGVFSVLVLVDPGDPELKVTLAWDDVPGTPNVNPVLVNDLDLRVFDPSSQQYYPWTLDPLNPGVSAVQNQANHLDNIEQVYVASPTAGVWRVEVHGYSVPQGPQSFSLCGSPELIACSSTGTIALNAPKYPCSSTAGIQVVDCDLNTSNSVIDTVTVTIDSDSEPGGESVILTETGAETADFRGSIPLDTVNSVGVLLVADGDTVTATYIDADDGQGGQNVTVTATAAVDCSPPVISNVQTVNVQARSATVTFDTDEPANGTVRHGSSCGALNGSANETGYNTAHAINLTGLQENSTYFYAVDAVDSAGNAATDDNGGACYSFTTPDIPDYFTEEFLSDNDLDNVSLTFTPDASADFYDGCAEAIASLPVDPSGGTALVFSPSADDGYANAVLTGGQTVSLYGTSYGDFWVGTNGYITFTAGDSDYTETLADHFDTPRISGVFDDLNPSVGGTVSWKQLADRAVVTWEAVPEYGTSNSNTFQIEMYFSGTIVISYLDVAVLDCISGLSSGGGVPGDFFESDLSTMGTCGESCSDGILNQGEDRIDCGGPCPACDCLSDGECDDTFYCTGVETCDAYGHCQGGTAVTCDDGVGCTDDSCNEGTDSCDFVPNDASCDDSNLCTDDYCDITLDCQYLPDDNNSCDDTLWCNGAETCSGGACQPGVDPCPGQGCDEAGDECVPLVCDDDGICEYGENCTNCPNDCISGGGTAYCGDGICQPATGEDCLSCASDCRGKQNGAVKNQYCCGDGDGTNPVGCDDGRCTTDPWMCSDVPSDPYCCGDGTCEGDENISNCAIDCGCTSPADCDDLVACTDDDCVGGACVNTPNDASCPDDGAFCNGTEYCDATADCSSTGDPCAPTEACNEATDTCDPSSCLPPGDPCATGAECCSGLCHPVKLTCK